MRRFDPPAPLLRASLADESTTGAALPAYATAHLHESEVDSPTIAYISQVQPAFDLLRQAEGQLAGLLVLAAAGSRAAAPDHPMLASARGALDEGVQRLRLSHPSPRGRHHHRHLTEAATLIELALDNAEAALGRIGEAISDVGSSIEPLKTAHRHLQWAGGALPGFEIVAFEQGCCAAHPAARGAAMRRRPLECK